jgi:multiple antibiotic resistance protein
MEHLAFVLTIFFMLLGPIKIIPAFGTLTRDADIQFKRALAIRGCLIASALVLLVALLGSTLLDKYHISFNALRIGGGLVLVIAALNTIFHPAASVQSSPQASLMQIAASPLAIPVIVPPAGIAAVLIFTMLAPDYPGMWQAIAIAATIMMILDFLVMYYFDLVMKTPGLMTILQVAGAVLVFVQVCIGIEIILRALNDLGVITSRSRL